MIVPGGFGPGADPLQSRDDQPPEHDRHHGSDEQDAQNDDRFGGQRDIRLVPSGFSQPLSHRGVQVFHLSSISPGTKIVQAECGPELVPGLPRRRLSRPEFVSGKDKKNYTITRQPL